MIWLYTWKGCDRCCSLQDLKLMFAPSLSYYLLTSTYLLTENSMWILLFWISCTSCFCFSTSNHGNCTILMSTLLSSQTGTKEFLPPNKKQIMQSKTLKTRSPAKPVLTFIYTYYFLSRHISINWTHYILQWNHTVNAQYPKLTNYPLQKTCFYPMMSWSYVCFPKGIC